jgi:hypothetical protein
MYSNIHKVSWNTDFAISCCLFRVLPEEMLVGLLLNIKYEALIDGSIDSLTAKACELIKKHYSMAEGKYYFTNKMRFTRIRCLKKLDAVFTDTTLSASAKTARLNAAIIQCSNLIKQRHHYQNKLVLQGIYAITLPPDFIVISFLHTVEPEYFLSKILADIDYVSYRAMDQGMKQRYACSMGFLYQFAERYSKQTLELEKVGHYNYIDTFEKLIGKLNGDNDFKRKVEVIQELAVEWCEAILHIPVDRCELSELIQMENQPVQYGEKLAKRWLLKR